MSPESAPEISFRCSTSKVTYRMGSSRYECLCEWNSRWCDGQFIGLSDMLSASSADTPDSASSLSQTGNMFSLYFPQCPDSSQSFLV